MRVAAFAHDPGGANAVAATVAALRGEGIPVIAFAKGPARTRFAALGVPATPVEGEHAAAFAGLEADLVLVGTAASDTLAIEAVAWATERGIPSLAVMDYWANYAQRFVLPGSDDRALLYPTVIATIDERAVGEMLAEGLPAERIRMTGQPYFGWLADRARPPQPWRQPRRILFASQHEAQEVAALDWVLAALRELPPPERFTVRFHPRQTDRAPSLARLVGARIPFTIDEAPDSQATIEQHDVVLGITSVILIEAALRGFPAGSVLAGAADTLATNEYGLTVRLRSPAEIRAFLEHEQPAPSGHAFLAEQRGADARVVALCRALLDERSRRR